MPNIDPKAITDLVLYMKKGKCDIGTLASKFSSEAELTDENNVKVAVKEKIKSDNFGKALIFLELLQIHMKIFIIMLVFMPLLIKL